MNWNQWQIKCPSTVSAPLPLPLVCGRVCAGECERDSSPLPFAPPAYTPHTPALPLSSSAHLCAPPLLPPTLSPPPYFSPPLPPCSHSIPPLPPPSLPFPSPLCPSLAHLPPAHPLYTYTPPPPPSCPAATGGHESTPASPNPRNQRFPSLISSQEKSNVIPPSASPNSQKGVFIPWPSLEAPGSGWEAGRRRKRQWEEKHGIRAIFMGGEGMAGSG